MLDALDFCLPTQKFKRSTQNPEIYVWTNFWTNLSAAIDTVFMASQWALRLES